MNLVRAEIARLVARRFAQVMVVLLLAAFGITVATTLASSHAPTAGELARAQARVELQRQLNQQEYEKCLASKRLGDPAGQGYYFADNCERILSPAPNIADHLPRVFVFEREIRPLVFFLVAFLVLFGFLIGASYIGAELHSGGMTNLLLWRPERLTVLGTKLGTLLVAMLGLSVVATVVYLGAYWVIAQVRGLPGDLDAEFWGWLGVTTGRGVALALVATAVGFAVATLGRHTAAALGAVATYAIVWEAGARTVMEIVEVGRPEQWMLSTYVVAWMAGEVSLWDRTACRGDFTGFCDGQYTITWVTALVVLLAATAAFVAAAFGTFRRRDLA